MKHTKQRTTRLKDLLASLTLSIALIASTTPLTQIAIAEEQNMEEVSVQETIAPLQEPHSSKSDKEDAMQEEPEAHGGDALRAQSIEETSLEQQASDDPQINEIIGKMTLDEKISQMIVPAIRTWDKSDVTSLETGSPLAQALQKHQYGGIILFGSNVKDVEQTANLVNALQKNNMDATGRSKNIPYLMAVDEEGGVVTRFTMGTRMTGSMAIGATGEKAAANAKLTGEVLGEECAALGFNLDFAPTIDVNSNPSNPTIGTRSFSDEPQTVAELGAEFTRGLATKQVIATLKHFPGHGDTANDTHIGTATVDKTLEELNACELIPFRNVIAQNTADMIMTAHITLPKYDDEVTFADGNKGYFPATMSKKVITDLLRADIGYEGVVITDALEMDALYKNKLVEGDVGETAASASVEYRANLAEKVINAGVDMLLIPADLKDQEAANLYDNYIQTIAGKVGNGDGKTISENRINQSVARILGLKQKFGILDNYTEANVSAASQVVGSQDHHNDEMKIARDAITLVKNDQYTLPLSGHENNVVIMGRLMDDSKTIEYALDKLKDEGLVDVDAHINNLAKQTQSGASDSKMHVTIDYYYDSGNKTAHFTNELSDAIAKANTVICFTASYDASPLSATSPLYQSVSRAIRETHTAGGKCVLLANNLPYDAARYTEADAIMLGYMSAGLNADPTDVSKSVAYNANVIAAICSMFDNVPPTGTLPVNIPKAFEKEDLSIEYSDDTLYERGYGLNYEYAFVKGEGATYVKGSGTDLLFQNNARFDKLSQVLVDGADPGSENYTASAGSTNITLKADYLDGLPTGSHTLTAVYEYEDMGGTKEVSASFVVSAPALPISYDAHNQSVGWKAPSGSDGSSAGITGESKRLEAIRVKVEGGSVEYRSHVQGTGWESSWATDGAVSGTEGQSKRIEAIQIRLSEDLSKKGYHVWYRTHVQTHGWLGWACDGQPAGTTGASKRAEAYEVIVLQDGQTPKEYKKESPAYIALGSADAHIQTYGWSGAKPAGIIGTTGQSKRLEAIKLSLGGLPANVGITYEVHTQTYGWMGEQADGALAGTTGESKRLEAVRMRLTGDAEMDYSVWYRVHSQTFGWLGWACDGNDAGTTGLSKRAEAIEVQVLPKGSLPMDYNANAEAFITQQA